MKRRTRIALISALAVASWPWLVAPAAAQPEETFMDFVQVEVVSGKVVHRAGPIVVIDVEEGSLEGMHKLDLSNETRIVRNGVEASVFDLRQGDRLTQTVLTTRRVPVPITTKELEEMIEEGTLPADEPVETAETPSALEPEPEEMAMLPAPSLEEAVPTAPPPAAGGPELSERLPSTASGIPALLFAGALLTLGAFVLRLSR